MIKTIQKELEGLDIRFDEPLKKYTYRILKLKYTEIVIMYRQQPIFLV
ncbi:TPA: hypothetical protein ACIZW0_000369 [Streptococcus agalactiae]